MTNGNVMLHGIIVPGFNGGFVQSIHNRLKSGHNLGETWIRFANFFVAALSTRAVIARIVNGRHVKVGATGSPGISQGIFNVREIGRTAMTRGWNQCENNKRGFVTSVRTCKRSFLFFRITSTRTILERVQIPIYSL